jgi:serine-type D-Ala-D-Ala carboxypeptidase/endopeptidase
VVRGGWRKEWARRRFRECMAGAGRASPLPPLAARPRRGKVQRMPQLAALRGRGALISHIALAVTILIQFFAGRALAQPSASAIAEIDRTMENFRLDAHVPGMVWGVVQDGRLIHVKAAGVQDLDSKRPVSADTLFRIASMTKAFTALSILKLRDEGKLSLDAPVETYLPELRNWKYPTDDSPKIRVRDLLTHTAGFVTDDPWGDRQTPLPEEDFTRMLREGVPYSRTPGMAMEYSNFGYALLGRIIANVSARPYKDFVQQQIFTPLGMTSTGYDVAAAPAERRALGYRWEDDAWKIEPTMAHGAFGAMGGIQTSANDYAKWVAFLLSAWPPRDGADAGPVRRSSVRELAQGSNFPALRQRPGASGAAACRQASAYAMGFSAAVDCEMGLMMNHGGGYPGYGSHVVLLPDHGVGIFAFANRTYAGPAPPVFDAAVSLLRAGQLKRRPLPPSASLSAAYSAVVRIFTTGSVASAGEALAMNFLMDRDADHWARDITALKAAVGKCDTASPIAPSTALAGSFTWICENGRVTGRILLAPTSTPTIQALSLTRAAP